MDMNNVNSENKQYLERAKAYNRRQMIFTYGVIIVSFILSQVVIRLPFFAVENKTFLNIFLMMSVMEVIIYAAVFYLLNTGAAVYRYIYWIALFISFSMILYPLSNAFSDLMKGIPYLLVVMIMLGKCYALYKEAIYLMQNPNAQYIYDRVLFVDEIENEKPVTTKPKTSSHKAMPTIRKGTDGIPVYYEDASYTKLSTRIAMIVYGSLMLFPVIIQIFHNLFVSFDFQSNFALRGMFGACVVSALSWTIAIFYMYYNQPQSKMIVRICWVIEVIRVIYYSTVLYGYLQSDNYPLRAFILFILLDALRYAGLYYFSRQIFTMETPLPQDDES